MVSVAVQVWPRVDGVQVGSVHPATRWSDTATHVLEVRVMVSAERCAARSSDATRRASEYVRENAQG